MPAYFKRLTLSFFAASTLFLWIPLYSLYLSLGDINFSISGFFVFSLMLTIISGLVFFTVNLLLTFFRLDWLATGALYFLIFWVSLSGLLLPLAGKAGMTSPENLPTNYQNLILVASLSFILMLLTFTKLKSATLTFIVILLSTSLGSAAYSLYETGSPTSRFFGLSSNDNVIILSFDGIAGNVAKQVIEDNPEFKEIFKDFIFYDNAVSLAPATLASLRSEVYGNINFRALTTTSSELPQKLSKSLNSIKREQMAASDVMTYGVYSVFNEKPSDIIIPGTLTASSLSERASIALSFYPHIAARIGTPALTQLIGKRLQAIQQNYLYDFKGERVASHRGASWDALYTLQSEDLIALTQNLHTTNSTRSIRYMHFLHTHFPVDFDENCTYRSDNAEWFAANQNYQGLKNETHCALQQTADFIAKLKELKIYDKSTLVVKSDHGALAYYFDSDPDGITFNDHSLWGYNRYRPLMMIKARKNNSTSVTYKNNLTSLSDLAKTLCLHSPENSKCDEFEGIDLLVPTNAQNSSHLYMDIVKDSSSSYDFDTQMTLEVPRKNNFLEALESTGKIKFKEPEMVRYLQRKRDLDDLKIALEKYYSAKGSYPLSQGFNGLYSIWGSPDKNWIPGLTPKFLKALPRDPSLSEEKNPQYLYYSDGVNYKLLSHGADASTSIAQRLEPQLVDPTRKTYAFGFWTPGAKDW